MTIEQTEQVNGANTNEVVDQLKAAVQATKREEEIEREVYQAIAATLGALDKGTTDLVSRLVQRLHNHLGNLAEKFTRQGKRLARAINKAQKAAAKATKAKARAEKKAAKTQATIDKAAKELAEHKAKVTELETFLNGDAEQTEAAGGK